MWYAQVALWLQEDVIGALADLNAERAKDLGAGEKSEAAWVGNLPVKRLRSIRLMDYVASAGGASAGGASAGGTATGGSASSGSDTQGGSTAAGDSFTERGSDGEIDVIHFELNLIIDARALLEVMNAISQAGFFTPLEVSFEAEPPMSVERTALARPDSEERYVYGPVPTISVTLLYEACFLREGLDRWMPERVASDIAAGRAGGMSSAGTSLRKGSATTW